MLKIAFLLFTSVPWALAALLLGAYYSYHTVLDRSQLHTPARQLEVMRKSYTLQGQLKMILESQKYPPVPEEAQDIVAPGMGMERGFNVESYDVDSGFLHEHSGSKHFALT